MVQKIFKISAQTHIQNLSSSIYNYVVAEKAEPGFSFQLRAMGPAAMAVAVKAVIKANTSLAANNQTLYLHPYFIAVESDKQEDAGKYSVCFNTILHKIS